MDTMMIMMERRPVVILALNTKMERRLVRTLGLDTIGDVQCYHHIDCCGM